MLSMVTQPDIDSKLARLQECINKGHIKASIQLCDSLLKAVPITDNLHNTLLKNKARLMLQGKQFSSLVHFSKTLQGDMLLSIEPEVAYAHYRLGNYTQALKTIKDVNAALLKAQILYRLDLFGEAIKEYELVLEATSDPSIMAEVSVNVSACRAALALSGDDLSATALDYNQALPEYMYNQATILIGRKEFNSARECLKQAIEACDEGSIKTQLQYQLAYCDHRLGLPACLPEMGEDKLVNSLILTLKGNGSPRKLISAIQSLMPKYATYQKHSMNYNLAILHHELGNISKAKSVAKILASNEHFGDMIADLLARIGEKE